MAIIDLEYTSWNGSAQRMWGNADEWREVVQIGAVLVDVEKGYAPLEAFESLVRPVRNPALSDYFIELTGIDQATLDASAVSYKEAFAKLTAFVQPADVVVFNGNDGEILRENCAMWQIDCPLTGFNFRPLLAKSLGCDPSLLTSSDLPALAGITFKGRAHSALADCRGIAAAFGVFREQERLIA
jgi:inhibitor of KinA sporulation pathway (predicted exonuclease)